MRFLSVLTLTLGFGAASLGFAQEGLKLSLHCQSPEVFPGPKATLDIIRNEDGSLSGKYYLESLGKFIDGLTCDLKPVGAGTKMSMARCQRPWLNDTELLVEIVDMGYGLTYETPRGFFSTGALPHISVKVLGSETNSKVSYQVLGVDVKLTPVGCQ